MKYSILNILLFCCATVGAQTAKNPQVTMTTNHGAVTIELFAESAPETVKNFIGLVEGTKEVTTPTGEKVKKRFYDGLIFHRVINNFMIQGGCPNGRGDGGPGYKFKDEINAESLGLDKAKVFNKDKGLHPYLKIFPPQRVQQMILKPILAKLKITTQQEFQAKIKDLQVEMDKLTPTLTLKNLYEGDGYVYNSKLKSFAMKKGYLAMANSGANTNGSQFFINLKDNNYLDGKHTVFGKVIAGMDVVEKIGKVETMGATNKPVKEVKIISIKLKK